MTSTASSTATSRCRTCSCTKRSRARQDQACARHGYRGEFMPERRRRDDDNEDDRPRTRRTSGARKGAGSRKTTGARKGRPPQGKGRREEAPREPRLGKPRPPRRDGKPYHAKGSAKRTSKNTDDR